MNLVDFSINLERNLSYAAYLCQYVTKKGIRLNFILIRTKWVDLHLFIFLKNLGMNTWPM